MAKHLGRVPIPGSHVEAHGLRFVAEAATGRRNKIESVLISRLPAERPRGRTRLASGGEAERPHERGHRCPQRL